MSKTIYAINGKNITLVSPVSSPVVESVPPAIYQIQFDNSGVHLIHLLDKYEVPSRVYSDIEKRHDILISDYRKAAVGKKSTGAILVGAKGCGKTLLMEKVSNTLISTDIPTIYLEENIPAFVLRKVIRSIGPCLVLFDEFEKTYSMGMMGPQDFRTNQMELLTLFSDSSLSGVMFILASNDIAAVNDMLKNRPGRIKRLMKFDPPDFKEFTEVAQHKGVLDKIDSFTLNYINNYLIVIASNFSYGMDVILELVELAVEADSLNDFVQNARYSNIPDPSPILHKIEKVTGQEGCDQFCRYDFEYRGTGSEVRISIRETDEKDTFIIPKPLSFLKDTFQNRYFEVVSKSGRNLKVYISPPKMFDGNFSDACIKREAFGNQESFNEKWYSITPCSSKPLKNEKEDANENFPRPKTGIDKSADRTMRGYRPFHRNGDSQ